MGKLSEDRMSNVLILLLSFDRIKSTAKIVSLSQNLDCLLISLFEVVTPTPLLCIFLFRIVDSVNES